MKCYIFHSQKGEKHLLYLSIKKNRFIVSLSSRNCSLIHVNKRLIHVNKRLESSLQEHKQNQGGFKQTIPCMINPPFKKLI